MISNDHTRLETTKPLFIQNKYGKLGVSVLNNIYCRVICYAIVLFGHEN